MIIRINESIIQPGATEHREHFKLFGPALRVTFNKVMERNPSVLFGNGAANEQLSFNLTG